MGDKRDPRVRLPKCLRAFAGYMFAIRETAVGTAAGLRRFPLLASVRRLRLK